MLTYKPTPILLVRQNNCGSPCIFSYCFILGEIMKTVDAAICSFDKYMARCSAHILILADTVRAFISVYVAGSSKISRSLFVKFSAGCGLFQN